MVIIEGSRWGWHDRMVFFPDQETLQQLIASLAPVDILRVRQTAAALPDHPSLIQRSLFRTSCIDLTADLAALYRAMDAKSCRYFIRKAERMLDRIHIHINDAATYKDFLKLYNSFVRLKGHTHPLSERRFREYKQASDVYVLYFDELAICGHIWIRDETTRRVRLVHSVSSRLESAEAAHLSGTWNRYLHWYEMQTYKATGIEIYDFGGVGDGTNSVAKFKLSFGGMRVQDHSYVFAGAIGRWGYKAYRQVTQLRKPLHV
jgi:hypothetical protein